MGAVSIGWRFAAVFDGAVERVSAVAMPTYGRQDRWHERLRETLAALLDQLDDEPALVRVCLIEPLKAGTAVRERHRHAFDVLARMYPSRKLFAGDAPGASRAGLETPHRAISLACSNAPRLPSREERLVI
jgi:hypothetical protein